LLCHPFEWSDFEQGVKRRPGHASSTSWTKEVVRSIAERLQRTAMLRAEYPLGEGSPSHAPGGQSFKVFADARE
jgi:hypothetical protein